MTWPTQNNSIAKEMRDFYMDSQPLFQQWWVQADIDTKMFTGQQDYAGNTFNQNYRNQQQLQFNRMLRLGNMIEGYQRDNRLASVVYPADNSPDFGETADQLTTVLEWCKRQDYTYEKISDCFAGSNVCGLNLLQVWLDHREDPESGTIRTDRIPFSAFVMDNYWNKQDLSDCNRIWTRKYLTKQELVSLFPKAEKELPYLGKSYASKDGRFPYMAPNWYQYTNNLYAYDEYWVKDYRKARKVLDRKTGEVLDWSGDREQFQLLRRINPNVELITTQVPTVKWHVLVNDQLIYEEKRPYGLDRLPFAVSLCYHFPEVQNYAYRYQGVCRNIRDSQVELNRRRNRLLDILDSQVQSGLMVKEDALVNPEDAFFQGPGKVLYLKQSANLATDIAPIPSPPVAQGWMELIATVEKEIMDIVGPEELFGQNMSAQDMSGVMMKLKMGTGLIGLRNIFDRLNMFQKQVSDIMLDLVQKNFTSGKVNQILGKPPTPEFSNAWATKYHCVIEEAALTSTQRQLEFVQAVQLKQLGIPISNKYILEKSTLQGKKEVMEDIQQQEQQAQQMQQMQFQAEMQKEQMLARSLEAKAQADFGSAHERRARAVSDIALAKERASQAAHDRASTALDNAKALHEIEQIDEDRLYKLTDYILSMQERQRALAGGEEEDSALTAMATNAEVTQANQSSKPQQPQQSPEQPAA